MPSEMTNEQVAEALNYKWDESRCRICGWPLADTVQGGCVPEGCSMRPVPKQRADALPDWLELHGENQLAVRDVLPILIEMIPYMHISITHGSFELWDWMPERPVFISDEPTIARALCAALLERK